MKMKIPLVLTRAEFDKLSVAFSDPSVNVATFELLSDVKAIHFDESDSLVICAELK